MTTRSSSADDSRDEGPSNFIDLEAEESGSHYDEDVIPEHPFPQFCRLPPELRRQVWEQFCPAMVSINIWEFQLLRKGNGDGPWFVEESATLWQQTEPVRAMLAIHPESREMALHAFPDTLSLTGRPGVVRFNSARDIVLVSGHRSSTREIDESMKIPGFCDVIRHLAVDETLWDILHLNHWQQSIPIGFHFPSLETAYVCVEDENYTSDILQWCISDQVNRFRLTTTEIEDGVGEDAEFLYVWPDTTNHAEFAKNEVTLQNFSTRGLIMTLFRNNVKECGVELWPMVRFAFEGGLTRFERLEAGTALDDEDGSGDESPDEYESDGINDGEIEEEGPWTDEEDDLAVLHDDGDGDEASFDGFSPQQPIDLTGDHDPEEAHFSSPVPVSNSAHESEDSASDDGTVAAPRRSNKRRVVTSSDTGEDDGEPAPKRTRTADRRGPIVLSDTEDEDGDNQGGAAPAVVVIGDESEGEEAESEEEAEAEESEEEDDEDDERPKRPLSLVERLRMGREENPIVGDSESEEDGSDAEQPGARRRHRRGYDGGAYGDSDEDDEEAENSLIDGMAEESNVDDGEEDGEEEDRW